MSSADVLAHRCNIQALGDGRVLTFAGNRDVNARLCALGLEVIALKFDKSRHKLWRAQTPRGLNARARH